MHDHPGHPSGILLPATRSLWSLPLGWTAPLTQALAERITTSPQTGKVSQKTTDKSVLPGQFPISQVNSNDAYYDPATCGDHAAARVFCVRLPTWSSRSPCLAHVRPQLWSRRDRQRVARLALPLRTCQLPTPRRVPTLLSFEDATYCRGLLLVCTAVTTCDECCCTR